MTSVFRFIFLFFVAVIFGMFIEGMSLRLKFEDATGINWYSFFAAHDDCEAHFGERCKLGAGFRPLSQLRYEHD